MAIISTAIRTAIGTYLAAGRLIVLTVAHSVTKPALVQAAATTTSELTRLIAVHFTGHLITSIPAINQTIASLARIKAGSFVATVEPTRGEWTGGTV